MVLSFSESLVPFHSPETPARKPCERLSRTGSNRVSSSKRGNSLAVTYEILRLRASNGETQVPPALSPSAFRTPEKQYSIVLLKGHTPNPQEEIPFFFQQGRELVTI